MNKSDVLSAFNNHINEFFEDVVRLFPNDSDIKIAQTSLLAMRKANPKLIIINWNEFISNKYGTQIATGNIDFFLNKDYNKDFSDADNSAIILEKINALRGPISKMGSDNLEKTTKYIQNLTRICDLYHQ